MALTNIVWMRHLLLRNKRLYKLSIAESIENGLYAIYICCKCSNRKFDLSHNETMANLRVLSNLFFLQNSLNRFSSGKFDLGRLRFLFHLLLTVICDLK